ncbi:hypothetical protein C8Q75DRAFT_298604 [Abortiporus biennis]|nr:hypothetical protein C8Q75DRAFT_298604 [Abortiporus biennis]
MLKRQRPSSPSPISPGSLLEDDFSPDFYQPEVKRRKFFSSNLPTKRTQENESGEESDPEEILEHARRSYSRGPEWQKAAGLYKEANILLHDLHAEQRHRMLFAESSTHPAQHGWASGPPTQRMVPTRHTSDPTTAMSKPESLPSSAEEAVNIMHEYENSNRSVVYSFLSSWNWLTRWLLGFYGVCS